MIDAPFTPDQVQILNERQCHVETLVPFAHPFTSPHRSDERQERCGGDLGHPTLARNRGNKTENYEGYDEGAKHTAIGRLRERKTT